MKCLIDIQRKYHSIFYVEDKFKRIIKMIKESELEESKCNVNHKVDRRCNSRVQKREIGVK